jgi:hypothetical protein
MLRRFLIPILAVGTVAGYASGFHSLHCARARREAFERHVAKVCIDAARDPSDRRGSDRAFGPPF